VAFVVPNVTNRDDFTELSENPIETDGNDRTTPLERLVACPQDGAAPMTDSPSTSWTLAVDFGTSYTVAAVRADGRTPQAIEIRGDRRVPSVVLVTDDGNAAPRIEVGRVAEDLSATRPGSVLRAPKRRLGEPAPVVLGGRPYQVVDLVGVLLRDIYDEAVRHQGSAPARVCLTHPATWSRPRLARLLEAAAKVGLADVMLIAEPVAAALAYAAEANVPDGAHVAVYDLGGGTFDTTVLRADGGSFSVVGRPGGDANLGGELFDELLVNLIGERLDPAIWDELQVSDDLPWRQAAAALRNEVRRAKESLSSAPGAELLLPLPGGMVHEKLSQADLETVVTPYIDESVRLLVQSVRDAGVDPTQLASVYLVGGASRMPIVERKLAEALPGVPISRRGDPKTAVAVGATLAEPTGSVLDLQAAGGRTTLESQPVVAARPEHATPPPPAPQTPPADEFVPDAARTVIGSTVSGGTVVETGASGFAPPAMPGPVSIPSPPQHQPGYPAPPTGPTKSKTPLIVAAAGVGALVVVGLGFAVTRGGGDKAANTTTTTALSTTTTAAATPVTLKLNPILPSSTTAVSTASSVGSQSPTTTAKPPNVDRALTEEEAERATLKITNIEAATSQTGWLEIPFTPGPDLCGLTSPDPAIEKHFLGVRTESATSGVVLHTAALTYNSIADLNANFALLKQAATACPNPRQVEGNVTYNLTFTDVEEQSTPPYDRILAFGMIAAAEGTGAIPVSNVFGIAAIGKSAVLLQYQVFGRLPNPEDSKASVNALTILILNLQQEIS
jgi:actin-like ATPase involved in cell morphogenesis